MTFTSKLLSLNEIVERNYFFRVPIYQRQYVWGNDQVETLVEDLRIELRNFGVFEVKRRAARKARNPRTGDKVFVPEKFVVTFKPGKEMEERVREMERRAAEQAGYIYPNGSPVAEADGSTNGETPSEETT